MGIFTTRPIDAKVLVGYFYGTLLYDDPTTGPSSQVSIYGEGTIAVTVNDFHTMSVQLEMEGPSGKVIWTYPVSFCSMRFINDGRYLPNEVGRPKPAMRSQNPHAYRHNNV